jgi:integrase
VAIGEEGGLNEMPKLPKGMFKRGSSFYVRTYEGGTDRWKSLGSDYEVACRKLREIRLGVVEEKAYTVADAVEQFLKVYVPTHRSSYNIRHSESACRRYLIPFFGRYALAKVGKDDLRKYRLWLEQKDLSPQSVAHQLAEARCFFNWCLDCDLIDLYPIPRRLLPRIQERPPDRLSDEEVEKLVRIPEPYGFVVRLALGTGLRWGELTRLKSTDIRDGIVTVHHTKSRKVRRVPLPPELAEEVRTRVGRLVPYSSPGQFNTRLRILSKVWRFHMHQCRHTFACRWLEQGGSLAALQQLLGHSSIVTTQRYARLMDEAVFAEADRLYGTNRSSDRSRRSEASELKDGTSSGT